MYERGMVAKHRLGPILVSLNGNRAVATVSGVIDIPMEIDGVALTLSNHCIMVCKVEKREGVWGLMRFSGIYRRDELIPVLPGTAVSIPPEEVEAYRPAYRNLSWSLARHGYEVNSELPGEDRPETAAAMMADVFAWAGLAVPD